MLLIAECFDWVAAGGKKGATTRKPTPCWQNRELPKVPPKGGEDGCLLDELLILTASHAPKSLHQIAPIQLQAGLEGNREERPANSSPSSPTRGRLGTHPHPDNRLADRSQG
jgi:hypothetical protein